MATFDPTWLRKQGIEGSDDELTNLYEILEEELEVRVGMVIVDSLSDEQVSAFEKLMQETAEADLEAVHATWIAQHYPDYAKTLLAQQTKLSRRVRSATDKTSFITQLAQQD